MPDDYQSLFNQLNGENSAPVEQSTEAVQESTPKTEPVVETPTETAESTEPDVDPTEGIKDPIKQQQAKDAFAAMRAQNAKYQKVMKRIQEVMQADNEDTAIERLLDATYGMQAKQQNIDPAVLKRISELEENNTRLAFEQRQNYIKESFADVQKEFNLSDAETIKFAQQVTDSNIDIFASNVNLSTIYKGLNHDTITKKMLETEKQNWIKNQTEASKAPGVNPATGKKDNQDKIEINTMAELNEAMKSFRN